MKLFRIVLVCAFFLTAPATACADLDFRTGPPDGIQTTTATLADVLALNAKAEGKRLDSFASRIEEWNINTSSFNIVQKSMWAGRDYKMVSSYGSFAQKEGRIGGVRWEQNENGITVIMGGLHPEVDDFEQAMSAAHRGAPGDAVKLLGEIATPAAYVIEVRPGSDPPTWLFIDKTSGLIVREESVFNWVRTTTTYSDFKTISGATIAGKVQDTNGDPSGDDTQTLVSLHVNVPVTPADLNIPSSRRDVVQFPAGATSVQLPARLPLPADKPVLLDRDYAAPSGSFRQHIVVRVMINGRGLDFALDSGAGNILIDQTVAGQLGLKAYGENGEAQKGESGPSHVIIPEMHIGDLVMKDVVASQVPFTMRTADTEQVVGLLGFDFIATLNLKVDWDKGQVIAYPAGTMQMPATSVTLPLRLDDYVPAIPVSVGEVASDRFILDTGSGGVLIFSEFAKQHQDMLRDEGMGKQIQRIVPDLPLGVVGGTALAYPVQAKRIVFGVPFSEFLVNVIEPDSRYGWQDTDGLIGYPFLHYFNLYFDYPNSRIVLEPNDQFRNAKHVPAH